MNLGKLPTVTNTQPGFYFRIRNPLYSGVNKTILLRGQTNGNVVAASAMCDKIGSSERIVIASTGS